MLRRISLLAITFCGLASIATPVHAQQAGCRESDPINTLEAMWNALGKCWKPPTGSAGMEVTVRFSLKRDGSLNGKPQITWLKREGTEQQRRDFVASVFQSLEKAMPIPLTESMGRVAAGRPMTMRFTSPNPNEKTL